MYFFYYVPIGINARQNRFPTMTVAYAIICLGVFIGARYLYYVLPIDLYNLMYVPADGGALNTVAAAFLHVGYVHLIGNLVYLILFGRYIEDRMGAILFALIFLSSAGVGNYLQGVFNTHVLHQPMLGIIGASGAVSGVLGAFTVRFYMAKLRVAYWVFLPLQAYTRAGKAEIPVFVALALWFVFQSVRGLIQLEGAGAHVAYVTHVAGFAWGAVFAIAAGQYREGRAEALLLEGERYLRVGQAYAAQGAFIRYLSRNPDDPSAIASLARALAMTRDAYAANKHYRKACKLLIGQKRRDECERLFMEAERGFRGFVLDPATHLDLAFGLERNLKPKAAIRAYENFERCYPDHEDTAFVLLRAGGLYLQTLSDPGRAAACYARLVDKYPADRWVDFAREQLRRLAKQPT